MKFQSPFASRSIRAAHLLLSLFVTSSVLANGIVRDSIGAVSSGRGGANIAHDDNLSVINDNPAGLAWLEGDFHIEISNDFLHRNVKYQDPLDSDRSDDGLFVLPQLAIAGKLPDWPVTLGLSAYFPGGYGVDYRLEHSIYGNQKYESAGILFKLLPSFAVKLGEHVSIGGGVGMGYSSAEFTLPYTFQTGVLAGQTGRVDADTDAFGVTGNFGIQIRPTDRLTIGVAYISQTFTEQEGTFDVDVTGGPLGALVTDPTASYDLDFDFKWPRSVGAGASYRFDWGRLSVDALWFDWSDAFDKFGIKLSNGDNPEFDALAGTTPRDDFPLDWRDSYSIRVGYDHFFARNSVGRIGYIYNLNPIPKRTMTPLLPGILEHTISFGYGHVFGPVYLDIAYQYAFGEERVGQSQIVGGDFDNSKLEAEAHWLFVTLGARF